MATLNLNVLTNVNADRNNSAVYTDLSLDLTLDRTFNNQLANLSHMLSNRYNFYLISSNALVGVFSTSTTLIESVLIISSSAAAIILTHIANRKEEASHVRITFLLSKICFVLSAFAKTQRCINSPSIPASPQFTTEVHWSNNVLSVLNCF